MKILPIASDSLGVRSMATYVETEDCKIFIDPSAALGGKRYGLSPAPQEIDALNQMNQKILEIAEKCNVITISHYHYDHYNQDSTFYQGKRVFAKDNRKKINKSQKERGKEFKNLVEKTCDLVFCDNTKQRFGNTKIIFSPPFFHGPENVRLGYVVMTTIDDGNKKLLHTSDVQGPITEDATEYILSQKPDLLILDGPPTFFLGWRFSKKNLQKASDNLVEIITQLKCEVILDHHLLRDLKYKEVFSEPYRVGKERVKTFAEYLGEENNTLEAHRKELWE